MKPVFGRLETGLKFIKFGLSVHNFKIFMSFDNSLHFWSFFVTEEEEEEEGNKDEIVDQVDERQDDVSEMLVLLP